MAAPGRKTTSEADHRPQPRVREIVLDGERTQRRDREGRDDGHQDLHLRLPLPESAQHADERSEHGSGGHLAGRGWRIRQRPSVNTE